MRPMMRCVDKLLLTSLSDTRFSLDSSASNDWLNDLG